MKWDLLERKNRSATYSNGLVISRQFMDVGVNHGANMTDPPAGMKV